MAFRHKIKISVDWQLHKASWSSLMIFMLITFAVFFLFCGKQKAKKASDTKKQSERYFKKYN